MNCWAVKKQYIHKMSVGENENVMIDKWKYKEIYDWKWDNLLRDMSSIDNIHIYIYIYVN